MKTGICLAIAALLLGLGTGLAAAQTRPGDAVPQAGAVGPANPAQLQLSPEQKATILNSVRQQRTNIRPSIQFAVAVGEMVPPSIELYVLPDETLSTIPQAKAVKYTVVQNQVVLVDPTTLRIVDVLH